MLGLRKECLLCGKWKLTKSFYPADPYKEVCRVCYRGYAEWTKEDFHYKWWKKNVKVVSEQFSLDKG